MDWDWNFVAQIMPTLLSGLKLTLIISLLAAIVAAVLGLAFAIVRRSKVKAISLPVSWFVEFIRGTPLLVQLYFIFYVLPDAGIVLSPLVAGVIGMGLHYATYTAEVYRAGIENVARGQWEAARATNLTMRQTWAHVIIPQAVPPMIPALANYLIAMFKETPLLSAITVLELMNQAKSVANSSYRYVEPITMVGVIFLAMSLVSVVILRWLEYRFGQVAR
ncbi:ectoine/hydroxyectoine ABC transporter permease subunit EhuD [Pseudorhodobacter sp.]|uniref:ectoine/hydroxyectoine ABC transporter permease subunit EhuD n=1 Tax=Pseudorhodobacter sp. TaxID=1934400 RepID=UPI002AFE944F|nr:ectoine/hydroxyectoine ABC transporter permease subunit EhuD [Pseudorhodobacter sp.]